MLAVEEAEGEGGRGSGETGRKSDAGVGSELDQGGVVVAARAGEGCERRADQESDARMLSKAGRNGERTHLLVGRRRVRLALRHRGLDGRQGVVMRESREHLRVGRARKRQALDLDVREPALALGGL